MSFWFKIAGTRWLISMHLAFSYLCFFVKHKFEGLKKFSVSLYKFSKCDWKSRLFLGWKALPLSCEPQFISMDSLTAVSNISVFDFHIGQYKSRQFESGV